MDFFIPRKLAMFAGTKRYFNECTSTRFLCKL